MHIDSWFYSISFLILHLNFPRHGISNVVYLILWNKVLHCFHTPNSPPHRTKLTPSLVTFWGSRSCLPGFSVFRAAPERNSSTRRCDNVIGRVRVTRAECACGGIGSAGVSTTERDVSVEAEAQHTSVNALMTMTINKANGKQNPLATAGFLSRVFLWWVIHLVWYLVLNERRGEEGAGDKWS